jgi:hypothetical protein
VSVNDENASGSYEKRKTYPLWFYIFNLLDLALLSRIDKTVEDVTVFLIQLVSYTDAGSFFSLWQ